MSRLVTPADVVGGLASPLGYAGAAGPNPTTPPVTDQLAAHYAARLESFADGDSVGTLTDQQNSNDLTEPTASNQPSFVTDAIAGHPAIRFVQSSGEQIGTTFGSSLPQPVTVLAVFRVRDLSDLNVVVSHSTTADRLQFYESGVMSGEWRWYGGSNLQTGVDVDTNWHIASILFDGASATFDLDGSQIDAGDIGANPMAGIQLGNDHVDTFSDVDIAEVLVYSKELTSTERSDIENWLNNTVGYGIF